MKQHITIAQLNKLSEKGKDRLFVWEKQKGIIFSDVPSVPNEFRIKPLNIGQMIEFLDEYVDLTADEYSYKHVTWDDREKELCDALWEACKEVLESQPETG